MQNAPVTAQDVMTWIRESLGEAQGRFEVQDLTFIRKSVKVVTVRRDASFELEAGRWPLLNEVAGRSDLTRDIVAWGKRNLPPCC